MKKAADYAKMIDDNPTDETLKRVICELMLEFEELIVIRPAKTDEDGLAIVREQDVKWRAICRRVTKIELAEDGFRRYIYRNLPIVAFPLGWRYE